MSNDMDLLLKATAIGIGIGAAAAAWPICRFGADVRRFIPFLFWATYIGVISIGAGAVSAHVLGAAGIRQPNERLEFFMYWIVPYSIALVVYAYRIQRRRQQAGEHRERQD